MSHQKVCVALWNLKEQCFPHYSVTSSGFDVHVHCCIAISDWLNPLCFSCSIFVCWWMRGCYWYQWCWESCTRQVFVCCGKAGLQLAPAMCKSQWVPALSAGGELVDWLGCTPPTPPPPQSPPPPPPLLACSCSGSTCASPALHFFFFLPRPALLHTSINAAMHTRRCMCLKQRCLLSHTHWRKLKKHTVIYWLNHMNEWV